MYLTSITLVSLLWFGSSLGQSSRVPGDPTCALIAQRVSSSSAVYYPGSPDLAASNRSSSHYEQGIYHWASSSTQRAKCVVEPGTAADVGKVVRFLQRKILFPTTK